MNYNQKVKPRYRIIRTWHNLQEVNQEFYSTTDDNLKLIDPKLTLELNSNGSLEFTMPYGHTYFKDVIPMADEFMVRDEITDQTLFIGRPITCNAVDFKRVKVYCEGAMAYLHDILIRPEVWEQVSPRDFFVAIIERYNQIKTPKIPHQKITPGECDITATPRYRYTNYDEAYSILEKGCLDSDGGYMMMRYDRDGTKTINWTREPIQRDVELQPVKFGQNVISFDEGLDLSEASTFIIPVGADTEEDLPGEIGKKKYTIDPVGLGIPAMGGDNAQVGEYDWIVKAYGYVEELKEYSEAESIEALEEAVKGDKSLYDQWPERQVQLECQVADLHFIDNDIFKFYLGQRVDLQVPIKIYTGLSDVLWITKIEYELMSAAPTIYIGELPKRTLSDQFRKQSEAGDHVAGTRVASDHYLYIDDTAPEYDLEEISVDPVADQAAVTLKAPLIINVGEKVETIRIDKVNEMELQEIKELVMFDKYFVIFYIWSDIASNSWATLYQDYWWGVPHS